RQTLGLEPEVARPVRLLLGQHASDGHRPALPLHDAAQNQIWLEIVQIALDLLAWMPMLALTGTARLWEPRRLRLRLFSAAAQLVTTGRRRILRLARNWPWTGLITEALQRLAALPNPG
ncbi:transposase, partial [Streptomyces mirabilis]